MLNFRSILKTLQFPKFFIFLLFEAFISFIFPMQKNFPGEVVLITGAANGIGRQIALNFALWGATLVLWDIDEEGNKETSRLAQENGAKRVFAYQCDCSNREEVYEQVEKVRKEVGDVSILINNAGILLGKIFCGFPDTDFEKTLRVSFLSQVWTCKVFLPAMIACNHGHLVSVASTAEFLGVYKMSGRACRYRRWWYIEEEDGGMLPKQHRELSEDFTGFSAACLIPTGEGQYSSYTSSESEPINELLLPIYDTEYVASKIMDAIQKEKFYLIVPLTLRLLAFKIRLASCIIFDIGQDAI
nr:PREDICTED: LOW QUALITY PROTEIN: epidermal retinol dehydrogenase 2 [Apteryx mantelli mantelli]